MVKYKPGDVISECEPFAYVVNAEFVTKVCNCCLSESSSLMKCSICKSMFYCSKACQIKDWKAFHKGFECSLAKNLGPEIAIKHADFRFVLRLLITGVVKGRRSKQSKTFDGTFRSLDSLIGHEDKLRYHPRTKWLAETLFSLSNGFPGAAFQTGDIIEFYCKSRVNGFEIPVGPSRSAAAMGLYIEAAVFDHSCNPNAGQVFEGTKCQVRAWKDIDTDTEKVLISYLECPSDTQAKRQRFLSDNYFFECKCTRCLDPSSDSMIPELITISRARKPIPRSKKDIDIWIANEIAIIDINQSTIGKYNVCVTEFMRDVIDAITKVLSKFGTLPLSDDRVVKLFRDFVDCALVTHGRQHSFYKNYVSLVELELTKLG